MKNLKKVLVMAAAGLICLKSSSFATELTASTTSSFDAKKMILLGIAVVATILVLYMSYKSDSPTEIKVKEKKKDKLKDDLVEKDNTYEVEDDEVYEEDKISPVSIGKDEDEISLFESVNNPDTEKEEVEEVEEEEEEEDSSIGFMTRGNMGESRISNRERFGMVSEITNPEETVNDFFGDEEEETIEEPVNEYESYDEPEEVNENTESDSGTMVFDSSELNSKINIFEKGDDEEVEEKVEEKSDEDEYNYDYDFDFDDEKEEKTVVEDEEESVPEETTEDLFEDVEEEPTEFVGFTTIKPKTKTRGNSRFDRPNYSRDNEAELNQAVKEMEEKVSKDEDENSADDFLAQMAKNLGGSSEVKEKEKKKKTTTKKTAASKTATSTTKKSTTATAAKKTTTRKTTKK